MMTPLAWSPKKANAYLDYDVDWRQYLEANELIVSQDATVALGSIEVDRVQQSNGVVLLWIGGGVKNQLAKVLVTIETNAGRTEAVEVTLPII